MWWGVFALADAVVTNPLASCSCQTTFAPVCAVPPLSALTALLSASAAGAAGLGAPGGGLGLAGLGTAGLGGSAGLAGAPPASVSASGFLGGGSRRLLEFGAGQPGPGANPLSQLPPGFKLPPETLLNACLAQCRGYTDIKDGACPGTPSAVLCTLQQCLTSPLSPVCIDGQTYPNQCRAQCALNDLKAIYPTFPTDRVVNGQCTDPCLMGPCGRGQQCLPRVGQNPSKYFCLDQSCSCTYAWGPVCWNGVTFTNPCHAACFGAPDAAVTQGVCAQPDPFFPQAIPIPALPKPKLIRYLITDSVVDCLVGGAASKCPQYYELPYPGSSSPPGALVPGAISNFSYTLGNSYVIEVNTSASLLPDDQPLPPGASPIVVSNRLLKVILVTQGALACPSTCPPSTPVCGLSDRVTYPSECEFRRQVCSSNNTTSITYRAGACGAPAPAPSPSTPGPRPVPAVPACPAVCTFEYSPVCGSDGGTYPNPCTLSVQNCTQVRAGRPRVFVLLNGPCPCPASCPAVYLPVCGSDGVTYSSMCALVGTACQRGQAATTRLTKIYDGPCTTVVTPTSAVTPTSPATPVPGSLTAQQVRTFPASSSITLQWTRPQGWSSARNGFSVQYKRFFDPTYTIARLPGGAIFADVTQYTLFPLQPATLYQIQIVTYAVSNNQANVVDSVSLSATTTPY